MAPRFELQEIFEQMLGTRNVYFQPPPSLQMSYPCIVYARNDIKTDFADNTPYGHVTRYLVTVIDKNPDSDIPAKIKMLSKCIYDRFYTADNLNHDVFNIFF